MPIYREVNGEVELYPTEKELKAGELCKELYLVTVRASTEQYSESELYRVVTDISKRFRELYLDDFERLENNELKKLENKS